ncbi:MAG: peptidyl-prolyl cis-trans isomerase, partial [Deltaproteobacteria bacterium]|nr:peptidyl-prolyl cis-trans isomerase [Deltaproteobacteria bacterium]
MSLPTRPKLKSWPLAVGASAGLLLAAFGLIEVDPSRAAEIPEGAVAVVNGRPILRADYERALSAVRADRRVGGTSRAAEQRVLERLIEEELLVQRGVELELMERDRRVRADLSAAVIDLLVARGEQQAEPGDTELREFYDDNLHRFVSPPLQQVEQRCVYGVDMAGRAARLRTRWVAGQDVDALAEPPAAPLPAGWLPLAKLRQYLGDRAVRATVELPVGEVSEPLPLDGGLCLLRLIARRPGQARPFEQVR